MISVKEVIVVEGKYDAITVKQAVSSTVIETGGFGIFTKSDKLSLLRVLSEKHGIIIFTDSDRAGFLIRGKLSGAIGQGKVLHAYIPDIQGRERRKNTSSKEGKLGVEGMSVQVILEALKRAGATFTDTPQKLNNREKITKTDLYFQNLSGKQNSTQLRREFLKKLNLPERLSSNGLLDVLNILYTKEEFYALF